MAGSIYRVSDGKWMAQVSIVDPLTGKRTYRRKRAKTRDEARLALKDLLTAEPTAPTGTMTLASWFETWQTVNLPRLEIAPRTKTIYGDSLTWYGVPAAGTVLLADFNASLAELWVERVRATRKKGAEGKRTGDPISASAVRGTFVAAVAALDTAVRDGHIKANPLRSIDRPKVPKASVPVTSADDCERLLAACEGRRVEPLAWFVAMTGCRVGEALALRWEHVNLVGGTALIRAGSHERNQTKTGRWRTITLLPDVVVQLASVEARTASEKKAMGPSWTDSGLVFVSGTGKRLDYRNVTRELQRACAAAGVNPDRPWHSLRHGLAHRLLEKGVPLHVVSQILGHSGIGITADIYGHVDSRVPVEILERALKG